MKIQVEKIKAGDQFLQENGGWTAQSNAEPQPDGSVCVMVAYRDGGRGIREWDGGATLEVYRAPLSQHALSHVLSDVMSAYPEPTAEDVREMMEEAEYTEPQIQQALAALALKEAGA